MSAPDGSLYFSDVHNGGVRRLDPDGSIEVVVPKRRGVGGISLHADGGIVMSGRNVCHVRDGETRILYERDDVGGFNDLFADGAGPRLRRLAARRPVRRVTKDRKTGDAYRIDAPGEAVTLYTGVGLSNGIGFSPDGRRLYHVDSAINGILVHDGRRGRRGRRRQRRDVRAPRPGHPRRPDRRHRRRRLGGRRRRGQGGPVHARRHASTGEIKVPATIVTSLCFAGADRDQLIVVTADNTDDASRAGTRVPDARPTRSAPPASPRPLARI